MKNWVKVYEYTQPYRAEIVKALLEDKGCNPVVLNKKDSAYDIFGQYEVHVAPEYAVMSIRIIENDIKFEEVQ
jgi:hypothetical protein